MSFLSIRRENLEPSSAECKDGKQLNTQSNFVELPSALKRLLRANIIDEALGQALTARDEGA
ncbi:hypothetical protein G9A89_021987 [Geosiphon pyriformis]|nr:hypothetical protein G9A89_021987 [Geosiphon pyriformis]